MSADPTPPPQPAPVPVPAQKGGSGCLPFFVFLLVLVLAACVFLAKKWPNLPREYAARVVVEVLDSPSEEQMRLMEQRLRSRAVLLLTLKNLGEARDAVGLEEEIEAFRRQVNVQIKGSLLTIIVHAGRDSQKKANALSTALQEDLREEVETTRRLRSQAVEAHINISAQNAQKARANLLDFLNKHKLHPDGTSVQDDAPQKGVARRLSRISLDLALLEEQQKLLAGEDLKLADAVAATLLKLPAPSRSLLDWQEAQKDAAQEGAPTEAAKMAESRKQELSRQIASARVALDQRKAQLESERKVLAATHETQLKEELQAEERRHVWQGVKADHDRQFALLQKLRDEAAQTSVDHSVLLRPLRVLEEANEVRVPDRKTVKGLKAITAGCAVLLIACLLTAITTRLCRRA